MSEGCCGTASRSSRAHAGIEVDLELLEGLGTMNEQILLRQRHCSKHLVSVDWLEDWIAGRLDPRRNSDPRALPV